MLLVDAPGGLDPVDVGHADVHQDHVGQELVRHADGLVAVGGFAHDVEAVIAQAPPESFAQHPMVIGQHQANGQRASSLTWVVRPT